MLLVLAAVVLAGLAVTLRGVGAPADLAGAALYTVAAHLVLALALPRAGPVRLAAAAFALSAVVELIQLTTVPERVADVVPVARYLLGTTFHAPDLLAYAVGALAVGLVDERARRVREGRGLTGADPAVRG